MSHLSESVRKLLALPVAGLVILTAFAHAQIRALPAEAKRATVGQPLELPYVNLNGKQVRLAPGGIIIDQNNRTIVHNALPPGAAVVFTTDINGDIGRIYLMTPQEQAQFVEKR